MVQRVGNNMLKNEIEGITKSFESDPEPWDAGTLVTIAHGLGVAPKFIQVFQLCVTDDLGYVEGEMIAAPYGSARNGGGVNVSFDATNLYLTFASEVGDPAIIIPNKNTGTSEYVGANANFDWVVRAFA